MRIRAVEAWPVAMTLAVSAGIGRSNSLSTPVRSGSVRTLRNMTTAIPTRATTLGYANAPMSFWVSSSPASCRSASSASTSGSVPPCWAAAIIAISTGSNQPGC